MQVYYKLEQMREDGISTLVNCNQSAVNNGRVLEC